MLFKVQAFDFKLQSVRRIAIGVHSTTESELFAFSSEVVMHLKRIDEVFDLPSLNGLVCEV